MNKGMTSILTGAAVTMAVGAAAYAMTKGGRSKSRRMKKTANKAMRTVGGVIDSISYMMK